MADFVSMDLEEISEVRGENDDQESGGQSALPRDDRDQARRMVRRRVQVVNALLTMFTTLAAVFQAVETFVSTHLVEPPMEVEEEGLEEEEQWLGARSAHLSRQRDTMLFTFLALQEHFASFMPRQLHSPWYIKPRSIQWFVFFIDFTPRYDPERFREFFRIGPNLFYHIVEIVREDLATDPPFALRILPNRLLTVERQVAIGLRRHATGDTLPGLAELFGLSKPSVSRCTWKFIQALVRRAEARYLSWPKGAQMQQVKEKFWSNWGFPNCAGCIDGTHIPIELPQGEDPKDYFDYKHNMSISVQAIVDYDLRFLDVFAGWPGSVQDTRLLRKSNFYKHVVYLHDKLNGPVHRTRQGHEVREYLLADAGYPCWDWTITPYPRGVSVEKDEWNEIHSQTRMCVERAFGRLKGTWRILARILWKPTINRLSKTVAACCILHNMIIDRREFLAPAVYAEFRAHPRGYNSLIRPTREWHDGGPKARNALFDEIMHRGNGRRRV